MKRLFLLLFALILCGSIEGQSNAKIVSPIQHKIRLAGSFGELRSNHFHSGIDIKSSKGSVGDTIMAVDSGFVSRVRISYSSYGKALYLDHPSGYTSVYAHLLNFSPEIEAYVEKVQKHLESYAIDIYLDTDRLPISKGQFIGIMGSTGRSYGPHLHFEMRHTKTEIPVNPLRFGLDLKDNIDPIISKIQAVSLYNDLSVQNRKTLETSKINLAGWRASIIVNAFDKINGSYNKLGLHSLEMSVDDTLYYRAVFDSISFDETRYINASIDYPQKKKTRETLFRCYKLPGNQLSIIDSIKNNGVFNIYSGTPRNVVITATDFKQNKTIRSFKVYRDSKGEYPTQASTNLKIPYHIDTTIQNGNILLTIDKNTLYKHLYLNISRNGANEWNIGKENVPLQKHMGISILNPSYSGDSTKYFLAYANGSKLESYGGSFVNGQFKTKIKKLGKFVFAKDEIAPTIELISGKASLKSNSTVKFRIKDNISTSSPAKNLRYNCWLNDQWLIAEYSSFRHTLDLKIPTLLEGKKYQLTIQVIDDRDNKATKSFFVQ